MAGTKDIKDFTKYPSLSDNDYLLGTKTDLGGTDAGITVSAFKKQVAEDVKPVIKNGYWWVMGINTGVSAAGKTPIFRKTSAGLEMKYEGEDDASYVLLIPMADLAFTFDDLSPEQVEDLKLKFTDLTEADKLALRGAAFTYDKFTSAQLADLRLTWDKLTPEQKNSLKGERGYSAYQVWTQEAGNAGKTIDDYLVWLRNPATEAAAEVRGAMAQIVQDVSQVIGATNTAKDAANTAAGNANTKASLANSAATAANTAKDNANAAIGRVDTAITNATTAATTANTAAGSVDTAKTAATKAATAANTAAGLANTATTNANTEAGKATTAAGLANTNAGLAQTAAGRANTAAEAAESVVSGIRPDWAELNSGSSNYIANKPVLKPVATSGSYNDLSNKPTIPAAYTHPAFTARTSGLYKITVNNQGHVTEVVAVSKADITNLGIPAQDTNTTYSPATAAVDGLMSKADKSKIDGVAASANNYTHPTGAGYTHIPTGGAAGQYLKWLASGTAVWAADNNTTYNVVTTTVDGLMSAADKKRVDYSYGRNDIATLLNLPVTKRTITATLSGATSLSLSTALEEGQELLIRCVPSAAFTQPLPNVGGWTSMSGASFAATANKPFEISIWCYKTGYYSAVVKEQD